MTNTYLGPVYKDRGLPKQAGSLALAHFLFFSSSSLQGSHGYPGRRVTLSAFYLRSTLTGGLTFSLGNAPGMVNPPPRVKFLLLSVFWCCRITLPMTFCL